MFLNPILHGGAIMARTTKDRLPFPHGLRCANQIPWLCFFYCFTSLRRVIFRKKIFLQKILNVVKNIQRGDPSMQKSKFSKKYFFFGKHYFFCLNMNCTWSQLSFEVHISSAAQNFKFLSFFPWNFQFWPSLLAWPWLQNYTT